MVAVNAKLVRELRERTGAGMMACKEALGAAAGDIERAVVHLKEKGLAASAKKAGRVASEGAVGAYVHGAGRIGVLVEVNSETDFVARNEDFRAFVHDVALHVAAANPRYLRRDEVPAEEVEAERRLVRVQAADKKLPPDRVDGWVEGRVEKFFQEVCLLEQPFVRDPRQSIEQLRQALASKIGEKIDLRRFVRFALGEGVAKPAGDDFAQEVHKVAAGG